MSTTLRDHYCVIGNPIAHSKSPLIHAAFAAQVGHDLAYRHELAPLGAFEAHVRGLIAAGVRGANVTLPFKLDAARLATTLSARAQAAGAVNTLSFQNGAIVGDNTDGPGLVADIVRNAGVDLTGKRILLLGAGGAARGVVLPILQAGAAAIVVANRTRATADALVATFADARVTACEYADVGAAFDVVVNATSASLAGALPPVPAGAFGVNTLAYDMMYAAAPTPFMALAASQGAQVRDGLGMLVEQAAEAFALWRGVRPDTTPIFTLLRAPA